MEHTNQIWPLSADTIATLPTATPGRGTRFPRKCRGASATVDETRRGVQSQSEWVGKRGSSWGSHARAMATANFMRGSSAPLSWLLRRRWCRQARPTPSIMATTPSGDGRPQPGPRCVRLHRRWTLIQGACFRRVGLCSEGPNPPDTGDRHMFRMVETCVCVCVLVALL